MRDIRLGSENESMRYEKSMENYMWKWIEESHFLTLKDGHSL